MRPPPPPRKCNLQGGQGPTARHEEAAVPRLPPPVSAPRPAVAQALRPSPEPRPKRDFKLFAWALTIAGCGLIVLAAGTLAIRQELGHELRQLVAEYEAKKHDLVAEYQAKKRELDTEYEAKTRELTTELATEDEAKKRELDTEYGAKKRDLVSKYAAKTHELIAEYQAKKDRDDAATRQAVAEYKGKEEQLVAEFDRRLEAMHGPNEASTDPQETANIFYTRPAGWMGPLPVPFGVISPDDLHETERLGSNWRDNVDWNSPAENFGKSSRPDRVEADRYQYFVDGDGHPITPAEVEEYLALPQREIMTICSLSRRRLLTMRDTGVADPSQPPNGRAAMKADQASPSRVTSGQAAQETSQDTSGSGAAP